MKKRKTETKSNDLAKYYTDITNNTFLKGIIFFSIYLTCCSSRPEINLNSKNDEHFEVEFFEISKDEFYSVRTDSIYSYNIIGTNISRDFNIKYLESFKDLALNDRDFEKPDNKNVIRKNDTLSLYLESHQKKEYIDDTTGKYNEQTGYSYVRYFYAGNIKKLNSDIIYVAESEYRNFSLLNRSTGNEIYIPGWPLFSPGDNCFVAAKFNVADDFNGLCIYTFNKGGIEKIAEVETEWGPVILKWKNDTTIYIKCLDYDFEKANYVKVVYRKAVIYSKD